MAKTHDYIMEQLGKKGALLAALVDPIDYPNPDRAVAAGKSAAENGADYILLGGSIGVQGEILDRVAKDIKSEISIPLVLFPGNISTVTRFADAVYFMSLVNSRNPYWISQAQMLAAQSVAKMQIEPLPVGYIVCEPGGTVGYVGDVNLVPRGKPQIAAAHALACQFMGMKFVLTDSGSNPANGPIPPEFAKIVAGSISVPYIIGGGVRTPEQASSLVKAGADILQVGTALESGDAKKTTKALSDAIHEAGKGRKKKFLA
jgi:phosphoglycerol geranylgeranyltransferase